MVKLRADGRQDSDRPHYYSQYWIDVAMGKQAPSLPEAAAVESVEEEEDELDSDILAMARKPEPKPKPAEKKPEARPTITSLADLANIDMLMKSSAAMDDDEAPDISSGLESASPDITFDLESSPASPAEDDEESFDAEEDEDEWGGGRRKPKPGKTKRHERRDF